MQDLKEKSTAHKIETPSLIYAKYSIGNPDIEIDNPVFISAWIRVNGDVWGRIRNATDAIWVRCEQQVFGAILDRIILEINE